MDDFITVLITLFHKGGLFKIALKTNNDEFKSNYKYFREEDVMKLIKSLLPEHLKNCGQVVAVEEIQDAVIIKFVSNKITFSSYNVNPQSVVRDSLDKVVINHKNKS